MSQTEALTDDDYVEELPKDDEDVVGEDDLDEEEIEEEEEEEEEEDKWTIYDSSTFISGPYLSEKCTISEDILQFHFSFGYDCRKYFNLTVADPDSLVFGSGNLINFLSVPSGDISFRRSALGGGIGHIKANPNPEFPHIAIAENGENGVAPLIIIYEWPTLDINCVLKGGSSKLYTHLDFSPDGLLMVSQGGEPDYLITIWNWPKRKILLRTKSYVNDVHRVKFSPYVPGQLTSCGISHIKFWKMALTFTGLKLKGEIGRFGKTEFSDILGALPMPDEKVISGCSWGNILVWDAGLIKLEVFRSLRRKCHEGPIVQIFYANGELWTISMDGHVKIWWYEKIDQADPPDDDRIIQIEPSYDFYTPGLMLMCIRKRYPDPLDAEFFGQDGNGGIWILDLDMGGAPKESQLLYKCHAGKVADLAACPWGPYFASFGQDGRIYLYDYPNKSRIFDHQFPAKGTCMIWVPPLISPSGDELIFGFDDGTLRLCILDIRGSEATLRVTQITKPHDKSVTKITINRANTVLVSGGEDSTIFVFQIVRSPETHISLVPIGYVRVANPVTYLTWHSTNVNDVLVGCLRGELAQVEVPTEPQEYTTVSYLLKDLNATYNVFKTYKAQIRRDIRIKEIEAKKAVKVEKKRKDMEKLKKENPGLEIDEDVFLADSETEEELEPLHIPEIPNSILWMQHTPHDTVWLSMGGYDAGYIYEYKIDQKQDVPYRFKMVFDGDDIEISSYLYNYNEKYLIFAMQNGEIRINKTNPEDYTDLSDYWSLAMHDNLNGFVPKMCFSYDEKYFFTCGHDGNVFAFTFHPEDDDYLPQFQIPYVSARQDYPAHTIEDESWYPKLSIEAASLKKEQDRIDAVANANKDALRKKLKKLGLRFNKILKRNAKLLKSQIIPTQELELDHRVTQYVDMKFEEELALVKRKLAFDVQKSEVAMRKLMTHFIDPLEYYPFIVRGINSDVFVKILRQRRINPKNKEMLSIVDEKIAESAAKSRPPERAPPPPKQQIVREKREKRLEYFLVSLSPSIIERKLGPKLTRTLQKYRDRKIKWEKREAQWKEFLAKKPAAGINSPEDEAFLQNAKMTIGDFKLKTSENYVVPAEERATTVVKYKELLLTRSRQHKTRDRFNKKVDALREEKRSVLKQLEELGMKLIQVHQEIAEPLRKPSPSIPAEDPLEFPERVFDINATLRMEDADDAKSKQQRVIVVPMMEWDDRQRDVLGPERPPPIKPVVQDIAQLTFDELVKLGANETRDTPWEHEMRQRRSERKLFDQDQIIGTMNAMIEQFNQKIQNLTNDRYSTVVDAKVVDLFMITLQQELIVLKDFEALEDDLQDKVNDRMREVMEKQETIENVAEDIKEQNRLILKLLEETKIVQADFVHEVQDNKFFEFLKKVFKKKYKPPKVHHDDESSSESSSSSSSSSEDDDDGKSIDSRDFGIIKQDLNVCPKGCDPATYDYTVEQRGKRHQLEIKVKEAQKTIELLKKDLEIQTKKVKVIEKALDRCKDDLQKFQREKQQKLNQVRCTVILKLDQLQHLTADKQRSKIMDTLVFGKAKLSSLYKRVDELQVETESQMKRHRANVKHLTRMTTDCKYMSKTIKTLTATIAHNIKMKFGRVIDINEIEEAMLKRTFGKDDINDLEEVLLKKLVHDLKLSLMDLKGMYLPYLNQWSLNIEKAQKELTVTLRNNTSRKELLIMLGKEKLELAHDLTLQERKRLLLASVVKCSAHYEKEIEKLEAILGDQKEIIREIREEIQILKTKGMAPQLEMLKQQRHDMEEWEKFRAMAERGIEEVEIPETKPFSSDILFPSALPETSEGIASDILREMFSKLNLFLSKKSSENFIKETLESIRRAISMRDLLDEIVKNLPIEPEEDQLGIIEDTAEQLFTLQEPDVSDQDIANYSRELIEDIVDEIILDKEGPTDMVARIVNTLVQQLPLGILEEQTSIDAIIKRMLTMELELKLHARELYRRALNAEAKRLIGLILQRVYDTGLDLIYYIND